MELFNPINFDESESFKRPSYPPKCESRKDEPVILGTGYFTIPITLIVTITALRLTAAESTYLLELMSRFNHHQYRDGEFSIADMEMGRILNTTPKTIQRGRKILVDESLLTVREGGIIRGGSEPEYRRTQYLGLSCPGFANGRAESPYLIMQRSTFKFLLGEVRSGRITHNHILAFLALCYFEFQARLDRRKVCADFDIDKGELRRQLGRPGAPKRILELSQIPTPDGEPLYRAVEKHHKLEIAGLRDCPETENPTPEQPYGQETIH